MGDARWGLAVRAASAAAGRAPTAAETAPTNHERIVLLYSSQTIRKPAKGPSESHHLLLGNAGSRNCHSGSKGVRMVQDSSFALVRKEPPRRTGGFPSRVVHHSPRLPSMSWRPEALGFLLATGWAIRSPSSLPSAEFSAHQADSRIVALSE